jgi:flagellar motor switch protein FliM
VIMGLTVGSTLALNTRPDAQVTMRCGQVQLLRGRVGRRGDNIAIRIDEQISSQERQR